MTFSTVSKAVKGATLLSMVLLAASAFAGATKQNLELSHPVNVNGTTLKAGQYQLQWDGAGPNVEVSIMKGKNVVAKVPAHVVELPQSSNASAAVTKNGGNGVSELAGARFEGKKYALEIGEASGEMSEGSSK